MAPLLQTYDLPAETTLDDALAALAQVGVLDLRAPRPLTSWFLETADGRLFHRGVALALEADGEALTLRLQMPDEEVLAATTTTPHFSWDLPAGALAAQVESPLSVRRLLPLVELRLERAEFTLTDPSSDRQARGRTEEGVAGAASQRMPARLRIMIDSDEAWAATLSERLEAVGAQRITASPSETALLCAGIAPPPARVKTPPPLLPTMTAGEASRVVHRQLLERIELEREGTIADIDSEFLHDFRVAVRRTRAALAQLPGIYDGERLEHFKAEFKWLARATGPTRDLDVLVIQLREYRSMVPEEYRAALDPLRAHAETRRVAAQRTLAALIGSDRCSRLLQDWRALLDTRPERDAGPNAPLPIRAFGAARLLRSLDRFERLGRRIGPESRSEDLHRLRLRGKKLRYLIEFLRALYPTDLIKPLVASMRDLQDTLGAHQDYEFQQQEIGGLANDLGLAGPAAATTAAAVHRLLELIRTRQLQERSVVQARFDAFVDGRPVRDFRVQLDEKSS